jgi:hypothetical protein
MHQTNITPINLNLCHNGRELGNEETVGSIGILARDQVVGKEMEVIEVTDEPVAVERGFGGTALHGRLGMFSLILRLFSAIQRKGAD